MSKRHGYRAHRKADELAPQIVIHHMRKAVAQRSRAIRYNRWLRTVRANKLTVGGIKR